MDAKSSLAGRRVGAHGVALLARADDVQASVAVRHFSPFKTSWTSSGVRVISIRRFSAFPSGVSLLETGRKGDRKSTRLNSSHVAISYAVFCLKKKHR